MHVLNVNKFTHENGKFCYVHFTTVSKKVNARSLLGNIWLVELWGLWSEGNESRVTSGFLTIAVTWVVMPFTKMGNSKMRNGKILSSLLGDYVVLEMPEKHSSVKQNFREVASCLVCLPHTCYMYLHPGGCCTSRLPVHVSEKKVWRNRCKRAGEKSFPRNS